MKSKSVLLSAIMILFCVGMSFAQSGFIKLGDIEGESTDNEHKDWIVIESMSMGMGQQRTTTGATRHRGRALLEDLRIVKKVDKASPKLMAACAKGMTIPKLELEMVSTNGRTYYKVTLEKVRISSISTNSPGDTDSQLFEEVAFNYTKITWEYTASDGSKTTATYNAQTGN